MVGPTSSRNPQLDGVRGVAILLVVVYHYIALALEPASGPVARLLRTALGLTWSGVDLFFVLSGFLIGGVLLDHCASPNYFKAFYARRLARILPLYWVSVVLFLGIGALALANGSSPPLVALFGNSLPVFSYLSFTQNIWMALQNRPGPAWLAATWSLAVEEQFYLVLPVIIRLVNPNRLPFLMWILILAAPLWRVVQITLGHSFYANYVLFPARMDGLWLGVLCAYLVRQPRVRDLLKARPYALYLLLVPLITGLLYLARQEHPEASIEMNVYGYTWIALLFACVVLLAATESHGIVSRITRHRLPRHLGVVAYGIYLFHDPVNRLTHAWILDHEPSLQSLSSVAVTLAAFLLTVTLATISWNAFEKKMLMRAHEIEYDTRADLTSSGVPAPTPAPPVGGGHS